MALIYIADDEMNIRTLVAIGLKDSGFETAAFADGTELLNAVKQRRPDAIILDWMMPHPDGLAVCRALREDSATRNIPILMLTARGAEIDRVLGLEIGADDYIVKPFSVKELCARVRAVLRRTARPVAAAPELSITKGNLSVDILRHTVKKDGRPIELTLKEFDLLVMLMKNSGKVLTRNILLDKVWGTEYYGDTRTVDVHIRYLRQKIEDNPDSPSYIYTVRGVGYKFTEPD
ncbi:response regulator transcription factor [Caproiciproducens galactitolivorans]|uniref:Stage 0 sporulation protein A homolog n=1 Tax=Caproiciproducens galactitolivorans TaxID=642589 RepID=A0A4Z0YET3_9FIRM|nr:response regulator transcription factor [Caproiciproducens galactitolivorans]QEY33644.1 response regulator transcription factor [Caproiciproducens galactitolivorans]TGJ76236.1 sensory transduction protein regX3 [Caproiciproducens galactitolivorans]